MADPDQQNILEDLAQMKRSQQLWQVHSARPTQTQDQMTGGLAGTNVMSDMAAIQRQQVQQIHAYSMGVPGVLSPTQTMANPMAANYMLQSMYMMNPYQANFYQGQNGGGGGGGMSLAPASMMTPAQFGIFRGDNRQGQIQPAGMRNAVRDIFTLSGYRAFAPYEDSIDETIAARRRMTQRGESLAAGGVSAGLTALSFGVSGAAGLAIGFGIAPAVDTIASSYFQRRAETEKIHQISRQIATGSGATGFRGQGFSLEESSRMMGSLRKESAKSPFFNMADYMDVLDEGTQAGLFAFQGNAAGTEKRLKEVISNIDIFMKLAGDPDVRSAVERMGSLQSMGFSGTQSMGAITQLRGLANTIGTTVDQAMKGPGAFGAQMAVQMGAAAGFGMMVGVESQAAVRAMTQRGALTPLELSMRGGEEGASQSLTQMMTNSIHSEIGTNVASMISWDSTAHKWKIDEEKKREALKMDSKQLIDNTMKAVSDMGKSPEQLNAFIGQKFDLTGSVEQSMDFVDRVKRINKRLLGIQNLTGLSRHDAAHMEWGEQAPIMLSAISNNSIVDYVNKQREAMATTAANNENKYRAANTPWARLGTSVMSGYNSFINIIPFDRIAANERHSALEAAGIHDPIGFRPDLAGLSGKGLQSSGFMGQDLGSHNPNGSLKDEYVARLLRNKNFTNYVGAPGLGWDNASAAKKQEFIEKVTPSLEAFGEAYNATPDAGFVGRTSAFVMEGLTKRLFRGEGTDTQFQMAEFNKLEVDGRSLTSAEKRAVLDQSMRGNEDAISATNKAFNAYKAMGYATIDSGVSSAVSLLRSAEKGGIGKSQQGIISSLADYLGSITTGPNKGSLSNATYDVLSNIASTESSGSGVGYADLITGAGRSFNDGINPADVATKINEARAALADANKASGGPSTLPAGNGVMQQAVSSAIEGTRGMQQAKAQLELVDYASAPSAWSNPDDVKRWESYKTDSAMVEYRKDIEASGGTVDPKEEASARKGVEADYAKRGESFAKITDNNLTSNRQLDMPQNIRRIANAMESIQEVMGKVDSVVSHPKHKA